MDYEPLFFIFMFGSSILFSDLAFERETVLSGLLASFFWLLTAIFSFMLGPTSVGVGFAWSMGLISVLFLFIFARRLQNSLQEKRKVKFEVWEPI